jgi:uncharacterized protein (TIGR02996 family)
MPVTHAEWEALLNQSPGDRDTRSVYADWLDEQGLATEAAVQRWLAQAGKYPEQIGERLREDGWTGWNESKRGRWHWWTANFLQGAAHARLPDEVCGLLPAVELIYDSRAEAEAALARVWHRRPGPSRS